jgi:tetratricopeptide (TPR) repeat protein
MTGAGWLRVVLWVLAALVVAPSRAAAEGTAQARASYRRGVQHYNLGEYEDALRDFKDAYRRQEDPAILFNIAQCERQLGHKPDAVRLYRSYLAAAPAAPNRADVEDLVAKLQSAIAAEQAAQAAPPPVTEPPPPTPVAVVAAPRPRTPVYKRWWLWTPIGLGLAGVALGLGLGLGLQPHAPTAATALGTLHPGF